MLRAITAGLYDSDDDEDNDRSTPLVSSAFAPASAPALFDKKRSFDALVSSDEEDGASCLSESSAVTRRRRPSSFDSGSGAFVGELTSKRHAPPRAPSRSPSLRSSGSCFGGEGMLLAACHAAEASQNAASAAAASASHHQQHPEQPTTPLPPRLHAALVSDASPSLPSLSPALSPAPPLLSPRRLKALGRDYWGDAAPPPPPGSAFDVGLPAECCGSGCGGGGATSSDSEEQLQRCRRLHSPFEQQQQKSSSNGSAQDHEIEATTPRSLPSLSLAGICPAQVDAALGSATAPAVVRRTPGGGVSAGPLGLALDTNALVLEINSRLDAAARLAAAAAAGLL